MFAFGSFRFFFGGERWGSFTEFLFRCFLHRKAEEPSDSDDWNSANWNSVGMIRFSTAISVVVPYVRGHPVILSQNQDLDLPVPCIFGTKLPVVDISGK